MAVKKQYATQNGICVERVLVYPPGGDGWIAHPTRGEFQPCGTYPPVRETSSGNKITRTSDSGRKMTLVVDRAGAPFATKSVNMGRSVHLRQHQPLVRYLEPGQEDEETGEEPKTATGKFPWLLVGALVVGAFILFRNA